MRYTFAEVMIGIGVVLIPLMVISGILVYTGQYAS